MNCEDEMVVGPVDIDVVAVKPLDGFRICVKFSDGEQGELDLTEYSEKPWFQPWQDRSVFDSVHILRNDVVVWGDDPFETDMGICSLSLYMDLTGKSWEELDRAGSTQVANA